MSRVAWVLGVLLVSQVASGADLPPGAVARLGDDRFRAGGAIEYLAISPDGKQFATARDIGGRLMALTVWDAETGRPVREQRVNGERFIGVAWAEGGLSIAEWPEGVAYTAFRFSADGRRVAARWKSPDGKHAVHVFELKPADTIAKLKRAGTIDLGAEGADSFQISADGKKLVTFRELAHDRKMTATTWDVATGTPAKPVLLPAGIPPILTPDAGAVIVRAGDEEEWGYDAVEMQNGERRKLGRWPLEFSSGGGCADDGGGFAFTPSGRELIVADDRKTFVIDVVNGKELARLEGHAGSPSAVAVSADGTRLATADRDGLVRLWDAKTFRPVEETHGHRSAVGHAELSPDGKRLLTWACDETVRLWDVATGKELRAFPGASEGRLPAFARDGTAVVYGAQTRLIARDLQTGLEVPLPEGASELKPRPAILSTDRVSARPSGDSAAVHLCEAATGEVRRELRGHRGAVRVLGFTPDGAKLLTAGGDHTVLVWDMRLSHVPLPEAVKKETDAAKLWNTMATGGAKDAYLAMARFAREPEAAVKLLRMKLKPAAKGTRIADARAIELLESLGTDDARTLLKELAAGEAPASRTQEAKRALERIQKLECNKP